MTIPFDTIKGILFDKDGTLFDFQQSWSDWSYRFVYDIAPDEQTAMTLAENLGFDLATRQFHPDSAVIAGTPEVTVEAVARTLPHLDLGEVRARVISTSAADFQVPVTPLKPLFETLRNHGLALGIATNDGETPARAHLAHFDLDGLFPFVAGYDSGFGAKPEPGQMAGFLRHNDMAAEQAIMVGDSTHDLEAGRAAGFHTIGVLTGVAQEAELAGLSDLILPSIADLPRFFAKTG